MPNFYFIAIVVFIILVISSINSYYFKTAIVKRKLKAAHYRKISSFTNGEYAKIIGKAIPVKKVLTAPLSDRECVYYHILVEQKRKSKNYSYWTNVIEENVICDFVIDDGTGIAMINHEQISQHILTDRHYTSGFEKDPSLKLENYLQSHNIKSKNWLGFNKTLRYKEGIIAVDEEITVLGTGKWEKTKDLALNSSHYQVLTLQPTENSLVYLSDDPETFIVKKPKESDNFGSHYQK